MLKRTLFFGSPGRLFIKDTLLCYGPFDKGAEQEVKTFPVEDIGCVVVESQQMTLTSRCIMWNIAHLSK